ncbi:hypothetical protein C7437_1123 [Psychrobacillus insolitus]|uniref:Uncharacterized protein n=1 Tax=Psychrobacillus insolitus TaxID=1461 RepID=A0A2W7MBW7_9BACI|nr:hypothetical protein [Psychrobacillus insolitus]PZX02364.1 hypothetical protein C7437_1123 [Psychrobacillus insolitus]
MDFTEEEFALIPLDLIDDTTTFASPLDKLLMICFIRNEYEESIRTEQLAKMTCTTVEEVEESFMRLIEMGLLQTHDLTLQ